MEVRLEPRLPGDQLEQGAVDLDSVERRKTKAVQPRLRGQEALTQPAEAAVIIGNVDTGQHDLLRPAVDLAGNRVADRVEGERDAVPTRLPDRAEGAAMVAAGLHGDEAAHVAHEPGGHDWRHDVIFCQTAEFA